MTKILQYEWTVQLLFQLNSRWRAYSFRPAVFLQPVGRTTGDCFYLALQAQRSALGTESLRLRFKHSQRLATSDGDGALELAERAHMIASGVPTMRGHCKAHKICTARINCFQVQEPIVEFLTKCALSLRFGNVMKNFRAAWRTVALEKMDVVRDRTPSIQDKTKNEEFLNAVAPGNRPFDQISKIRLLTTCEGDWLLRLL